MTRDELIEQLAKASWEFDGTGGPWAEVGDDTREDWRNAMKVAVQQLELLIPEAETALQHAVIN